MIEPRHESSSLIGLVAAVAVGIVVGGIALAMVLWVFGFLFGILAFMFRLAVIVGVASLVIWAVRRVGCHRATI